MMALSLRERLYSRLVLDPETGCLLWTGYANASGYGQIHVGPRCRYAHVVAWELENGAVPPGLTLDHVKARGCRHKNCANVAHLEPVTLRENLLRANTIPARNAAKTHCIHGHEFTPANTRLVRNGSSRACRACAAERARKYRAQKRQEATA